jgi:hypothetical protein
MAGRKNNLLKYQNIPTTSMTSIVTSAVTSVQFLDNIGLQFNFTGAPVGNFQAQVSADYAQDDYGNVTNPGNWTPIILTYWNGTMVVTGIQVPTTQGSPIYVDVNQTSAPYIRAQYIPTSGTGTLTGYLTAKML